MSDQHKAGIARLVAAGNMTHEKAGQYVDEGVSKRVGNAIPEYDAEMVRRELPNILEFNFDEDEEGCFAILRDGTTGEDVRVPFGANPPATSEELIECVHAHYRGALNTDAMDETAALFDAMEDD